MSNANIHRLMNCGVISLECCGTCRYKDRHMNKHCSRFGLTSFTDPFYIDDFMLCDYYEKRTIKTMKDDDEKIFNKAKENE